MWLVVYGDRPPTAAAVTRWPFAWSWLSTTVDAVGEQLVELDELLHVFGVVVGEHADVAEPQPPGEVVKRLHPVCDRGDGLAELGLGQVAQEHDGAHGPAKLAERLLDAVLPGLVAEPAQQRRRRDPALPDRDHYPHQIDPMSLDQSRHRKPRPEVS